MRGFFLRNILSLLTVFHMVSFSLAEQAFAQNSIPYGMESYLSRPDILKLEPKAFAGVESWAAIKTAQIAIVAELLELYPKDTQIYFLARDSEHLYDVARLATKGTADVARMHLLNISRLTMNDPHVANYLADNGITEKSLADGQKVLFVDTGFVGSIPNTLQKHFSAKARENLKTHLIVSQTDKYPSTRGFLVKLNPKAVDMAAGSMHSVIVSYEHLPRYTDRSVSYLLEKGRYHPLSPVNGGQHDGSVSKDWAVKQMQDIAADWQNPETKKQFQALRQEIRDLIQIATMPDISKMTNVLANKLEALPQDKRVFAEAVMKDVFESARNTGLNVPVKPAQVMVLLNQPVLDFLKITSTSVKYPDLIGLTENAEELLRVLIWKQNVGALKIVLSGEMGAKHQETVVRMLFERVHSGAVLQLQKEVFATTKLEIPSYFFSKGLSGQPFELVLEFYKMALQKKDPASQESMGKALTAYLHHEGEAPAIKAFALQLIDNASVAPQLKREIMGAFSMRPEFYKEELKKLIDTGDKDTLVFIAGKAFNPHKAIEVVDLIPHLVKKAGIKSDAFLKLIGSANTQVHKSAEFQNAFLTLVQTQDSKVLQKLIEEQIGGKVHARELILTVLRLASPQVVKEIAPAIRYFNGQQGTLTKIAEIEDRQKRNAEIDKNFGSDPVIAALLAKGELTKPSVEKAKPAAKPTISEPSPALTAGEYVVVGGKTYQVLDIGGEGLRGKVFKVRNEKNEIFALKVAKDNDAETLKSLQKETKKAERWAKVGVAHAEVLFQGKDHVLKTWIDGIGGEEVVRRYSQGDITMNHAVKSLYALMGSMISQGNYLGDFRPPNVIWTKDRGWVLVDGGSVSRGMTPQEARARWEEKFERRWKIKFAPVEPKGGAAPACNIVFSSAG